MIPGNIVKPRPAQPYLPSQLAQNYSLALKEKGIATDKALLLAVSLKVAAWYNGTSPHDLVAIRANMVKDLTSHEMTWIVFCKGAAVLGIHPYNILAGKYNN